MDEGGGAMPVMFAESMTDGECVVACVAIIGFCFVMWVFNR